MKIMKILHTSDWHLGRSFHGTGTLDAQRIFIDNLEKTVREEGVEMVLVAGDVYDRALPAVDVVALFDDALDRLTVAGAEVVVSSGNHDSATRLGFGGRILARGGVHLRTRIDDVAVPVLRRLGEDHRVALEQTYLLDRPYAEVAAELGVPVSTLRSRVFYGLKALRVVMEEMEVSP